MNNIDCEGQHSNVKNGLHGLQMSGLHCMLSKSSTILLFHCSMFSSPFLAACFSLCLSALNMECLLVTGIPNR